MRQIKISSVITDDSCVPYTVMSQDIIQTVPDKIMGWMQITVCFQN
jgi:hypothetical protein